MNLNSNRKNRAAFVSPESSGERTTATKGLDHDDLAKLSKQLRDERQQMEQQIRTASREEIIADLEKAIGKAFTIKRKFGNSKTVYLVEVSKRKVKVKEALERKDSASLSIEEFAERYVQEA